MTSLSFSDLVALLDGVAVQSAEIAFPDLSQISIDSRALKPGVIFVAIRGNRFDGHDFIAKAKEAGAVCAVVEHAVPVDLPQCIVADTRAALAKLAARHRAYFSVPVAAITGSYGKTTVKEMVAAILREEGPVLASAGSFNNDIGVPLTVLQLKPEHRAAVLEIGANHPGEIRKLVRWVKPTVATITIADAAHLAGFGRSVDDVARAKAEIFEGLDADGLAILNADSSHCDFWRSGLREGCKVTYFSTCDRAAPFFGEALRQNDVGCLEVRLHTPQGPIETALALPGAHQLNNALVATAVAQALGASVHAIQNGLSTMSPVKGRLVFKTSPEGARVIDDTYNAAPSAVKAGLKLLSQFSGLRIAVLADMLELGEEEARYHAEVGKYAKAEGIEQLFTYGPRSQITAEAFGEGALHFEDQGTLITALKPLLTPNTTVLIKGARSMGMEKVVDGIMTARV